MSLLLKNLFFCVLVFSTCVVYAQEVSSPLEPQAYRVQKDLGIMFGLGQSFQSGTFNPDCPECNFNDGVGFGLTIGPFYESEITDNFKWGAALLYDYKSISASFLEHERINVKSSTSNFSDSVIIGFRNIGDVNASFLSLMPYLKWTPFDFMFIRVGIGGSYVLSSNIKHTKEIAQDYRHVILSNGEDGYPSFSDNSVITSVVLDNHSLTQLNSLQFSLVPALGFNIPLAPTVDLSPVFWYDVPFTNLSEHGTNFKINSWRLLLELKVALYKRKIN